MREKERSDKEPDFMVVPVTIKELDKIELVKDLDGRYRMDHDITKNQKIILGAFRMVDADSVQERGRVCRYAH